VTLWIGTSGWQYQHWRGAFYPKEVPQARWLEYYAERFDTVEVNNAFYRLPEAATFAEWARRTPDGFVAAIKASRYLTHIKRLREPEEPVNRLMERAQKLGAKLGPVLLQLPGTLRADTVLLNEALACFPKSVRVAFEPRHATWFTDDTAQVLARHDAALCLADTPARRSPLWRTAGWGYLRFHEGRARPHPCYGKAALQSWAERVAELWPASADVFAYFNNDARACALRDARWFAAAGERAGLRPTRVPGAREVHLSD
jgi:uncharacterized protein YecE (DUF72 family)